MPVSSAPIIDVHAHETSVEIAEEFGCPKFILQQNLLSGLVSIFSHQCEIALQLVYAN
jgi:hypothetical protein